MSRDFTPFIGAQLRLSGGASITTHEPTRASVLLDANLGGFEVIDDAFVLRLMPQITWQRRYGELPDDWRTALGGGLELQLAPVSTNGRNLLPFIARASIGGVSIREPAGSPALRVGVGIDVPLVSSTIGWDVSLSAGFTHTGNDNTFALGLRVSGDLAGAVY